MTFTLVACTVPIVTDAILSRLDVPHSPSSLSVAQVFQARIRAAKGAAPEGAFRVAFFGDSTAAARVPQRAVAAELQRDVSRLAGDGRSIWIWSFQRQGLGPLDHFLLADLVVSARPDLIVYHFNPLVLSRLWGTENKRPQLAGWVSPHRLLEALRLPIHRYEVTADRLLSSMAIVALGQEGLWSSTLDRGIRLRQAWRRLVERSPAVRTFRVEQHLASRQKRRLVGKNRFNENAQKEAYGGFLNALTEHPLLDIFGSMLRTFTDSGIPVLVYLIPMNVEHFEELGFEHADLARSIDALRARVETNGGRFVDLHRLFADDRFRDASGHYRSDGEVYPHEIIARRVAPYVVSIAENARGRD